MSLKDTREALLKVVFALPTRKRLELSAELNELKAHFKITEDLTVDRRTLGWTGDRRTKFQQTVGPLYTYEIRGATDGPMPCTAEHVAELLGRSVASMRTLIYRHRGVFHFRDQDDRLITIRRLSRVAVVNEA